MRGPIPLALAGIGPGMGVRARTRDVGPVRNGGPVGPRTIPVHDGRGRRGDDGGSRRHLDPASDSLERRGRQGHTPPRIGGVERLPVDRKPAGLERPRASRSVDQLSRPGPSRGARWRLAPGRHALPRLERVAVGPISTNRSIPSSWSRRTPSRKRTGCRACRHQYEEPAPRARSGRRSGSRSGEVGGRGGDLADDPVERAERRLDQGRVISV